MVQANRLLGKTFIESQMIDECVVTREDGSPETATLLDTGKLEYPTPTIIYEGKCRVARILTKDKDFYLAEAPVFANTYKAIIPEDVIDVNVGDFLVITNSRHDPRMEGIRFRITDVEVFTHTVYRRLLLHSIEDAPGSLKGME